MLAGVQRVGAGAIVSFATVLYSSTKFATHGRAARGD
jgi:hypothetical protein